MGGPGSSTGRRRHPSAAGLSRDGLISGARAVLDADWQLAIPAGALPAYRRLDVAHANPLDRPTDEAYDAFVYLAHLYRAAGYVDHDLPSTTSFVIAGPLFVAIHLWSTHALAEIARVVGADPTPHAQAAERIHDALLRHLWDPLAKRFLARNLVTGLLEPEETIVSFAPLLDPDLPEALVDAIVADLESACFHPMRGPHFVVPTYSVRSPTFDPRRYWRGPVWLNTNWLLAAGLRQHGRLRLAQEIMSSSIELAGLNGFFEYFDPFSGAGYGSPDFSWTAALVIDFIERDRS